MCAKFSLLFVFDGGVREAINASSLDEHVEV